MNTWLFAKHTFSNIYTYYISGSWKFNICILETPGMILSLPTLNSVIRPKLMFVQETILEGLPLEGERLSAD